VYPQALVVTSDGSYPQSKELSRRTQQALKQNGKIFVFVIGGQALNSLEIKTERLFIADFLISSTFSTGFKNKETLNINAATLAIVMKAFFESDKDIHFGNNQKNSHKNFVEFKSGEEDWLMNLLIG